MGRRRWLAAALAATLAATGAWFAAGLWARGRYERTPDIALDDGGHALAAVIVPERGDRGRLVLVDLEARRVVRTVSLRSTPGAVAVDASSGMVVTAQCGGLGSEADDVAGIVDPRSGRVRYVPLGCPNPSDVAAAGARMLVLHGWTDAGRPGTMHVSVLDVARARVERSGAVPQTASMWDAAGGRVWSAGPAADDATGSAPWPLNSTDARGLRSQPVGDFGRDVAAVLDAGEDAYLLRVTPSASEATSGRVSEFDPASGAVGRTADLSGLRRGPGQGAVVGGYLAVAESVQPSRPSGTVAIVDRRDLSTSAVVRIGGQPMGVAGWGTTFVVVDGDAGRLVLIDPRRGRAVASIPLGARDLAWSGVAVVPARSGVSRR